VILPVYITSSSEFGQFDQLSMTNVPQGSPRLWAPFVGVVLNTAVMMVLLDQLYGEVCGQPATADVSFFRLCFSFSLSPLLEGTGVYEPTHYTRPFGQTSMWIVCRQAYFVRKEAMLAARFLMLGK
jgi:hypothetical protein